MERAETESFQAEVMPYNPMEIMLKLKATLDAQITHCPRCGDELMHCRVATKGQFTIRGVCISCEVFFWEIEMTKIMEGQMVIPEKRWRCIHCDRQNEWHMFRCDCGIGVRPEEAVLEAVQERDPELAPAVETAMQQDAGEQYRQEEVSFLEQGGESRETANEQVPEREPMGENETDDLHEKNDPDAKPPPKKKRKPMKKVVKPPTRVRNGRKHPTPKKKKAKHKR